MNSGTGLPLGVRLPNSVGVFDRNGAPESARLRVAPRPRFSGPFQYMIGNLARMSFALPRDFPVAVSAALSGIVRTFACFGRIHPPTSWMREYSVGEPTRASIL